MHHSQGGSRFTRRNGIGNQREVTTSFPRFWNWRCQKVQPCSPKLWVSQYCPPCEIILKRRQKDPGVKAKLEMSNCHRCSGACTVPTPPKSPLIPAIAVVGSSGTPQTVTYSARYIFLPWQMLTWPPNTAHPRKTEGLVIL